MLVRFKDVSAIFCSPFQKWLEVGHGIRNLKSTPPPAVPVPVPRFPGAGPQLVGSPTNQRLPRSLRRVWALWLGRWHEAGNGQLELRFLKVCQAYDMYVYVCMFMCIYIYICMCIYIYVCVYIYICMCIYIYKPVLQILRGCNGIFGDLTEHNSQNWGNQPFYGGVYNEDILWDTMGYMTTNMICGGLKMRCSANCPCWGVFCFLFLPYQGIVSGITSLTIWS